MSSFTSVATAATISGNTLTTVASGGASISAILPYALSGSKASYSGLVIRVNDATSGMAAIASGTTLYQVDFALHSGLTNALPPELPAFQPALPVTVNSGIVVQGAAGWYVVIIYSK